MKTRCRAAALLFAIAAICYTQHAAEAKAPSAENASTDVGGAAAPATESKALEATKDLAGHSSHGEAFDEGPRQEAYLMDGMGKIHFPITTQQARAQKFFNQGVAQLHGFWYFEAERSFRQTAALDPKCAMAYWGMAMANVKNEKRAQGFIAEAVKRKADTTPRESKYIDALEAFFKAGPEKKKERAEAYVKSLETIICEHPDDIEAKALLAVQVWINRDAGLPISSAVAVDALLQQVLKVDPMHPCHHYRIHLWDDPRPAQALDSAQRCGQTSPGIAHMWHMPGHIYSGLHRYADAAWHQEASARVDHAHMMRDRVLPDQIHNFAHNNEWLIRDLMHIGRVQDALAMAKNMIELPRHPKYNALSERGSASLGRQRLFEVLEKYELWDEAIRLCNTTYLEPTDIPAEQVKRLRCLG
ncbi:MAG: alkyl hydroperoxide reductase, partial [Planctomycetota bacterium]|nr:alkyl hydroperoxide reductase [Planctomycetota bacterium]